MHRLKPNTKDFVYNIRYSSRTKDTAYKYIRYSSRTQYRLNVSLYNIMSAYIIIKVYGELLNNKNNRKVENTRRVC